VPVVNFLFFRVSFFFTIEPEYPGINMMAPRLRAPCGALNSAGMRREKNHLVLRGTARQVTGVVQNDRQIDPPQGRPGGESVIASARTDSRRTIRFFEAAGFIIIGGMGASAFIKTIERITYRLSVLRPAQLEYLPPGLLPDSLHRYQFL
jgi:hypothetical protein